jgi:hypothetical protein
MLAEIGYGELVLKMRMSFQVNEMFDLNYAWRDIHKHPT